jgi:hypothetical protein
LFGSIKGYSTSLEKDYVVCRESTILIGLSEPPRKNLMNLGIRAPSMIVVRQTIIRVVLLMTDT